MFLEYHLAYLESLVAFLLRSQVHNTLEAYRKGFSRFGGMKKSGKIKLFNYPIRNWLPLVFLRYVRKTPWEISGYRSHHTAAKWTHMPHKNWWKLLSDNTHLQDLSLPFLLVRDWPSCQYVINFDLSKASKSKPVKQEESHTEKCLLMK